MWRNGKPVRLTATEFNLLRFFLLNRGGALEGADRRPRVALRLRRRPQRGRNYVSYLRKKLDKHGPPLIQTIRLVGYALREQEAD